jgi:hypothetical protein
MFASFAALLAADEAGKRKNFQVIKALKYAELKASLINEIAGIWENANKNPLNAIFPGAANTIAAVKTLAATARFGAGIKTLESTTFAQGGPVFGPSHQAGGIPFSVHGSAGRYEMEGNEIIMSKGVYENPLLRSIASELNYMGGGRKFALGGPVTDRPMSAPDSSQVSGIVRNAISQTTGSSGTDMRMTNELLERIEMNTRVSAQKPVLSTRQIKDELTDLNDIQMEARF